jgi:hypothetical protein
MIKDLGPDPLEIRIHQAAQLLAQGFPDDIVTGGFSEAEQVAIRWYAERFKDQLRRLLPTSTQRSPIQV